VFFVARVFLGNGDALLVAALAYGCAEARRRCRSFDARTSVLSTQHTPWRASGGIRAKA
jgi:hypothetical protein